MSAETGLVDNMVDIDLINRAIIKKAEKEGIPEADVTNRLLINEKQADEINRLYNNIRLTEPLVTKSVAETVHSLGAELDGVKYAAKTGSSVGDKLAREIRGNKYKTRKRGRQNNNYVPADSFIKDTLLSLKDVIRYTEIVPQHDDIIKKARDTVEAMEKKGYTHTGTRNYYKNPFPGTGYRGLHLNFVSPYGGQEIELQVHSKESFEAKQKGHELYEKLRGDRYNVRDKEVLREQIYRVHGAVPLPKDYDRLNDYFMDKKTKEELIAQQRASLSVDTKTAHGDYGSCRTFSVKKDGREALHGFEIQFPDGDAVAYRKNADEHDARYILTSKDASDIKELTVPAIKEFDVKAVAENAEKCVSQNRAWMQEHFPNGYSLDEHEKPVAREKTSARNTDFGER